MGLSLNIEIYYKQTKQYVHFLCIYLYLLFNLLEVLQFDIIPQDWCNSIHSLVFNIIISQAVNVIHVSVQILQ